MTNLPRTNHLRRADSSEVFPATIPEGGGGSQLALYQKLFFEARPGADDLRWKLDEQAIGNAGGLLLWTPVPGKHTLTLVDATDRTLDSVAFEVRGRL